MQLKCLWILISLDLLLFVVSFKFAMGKQMHVFSIFTETQHRICSVNECISNMTAWSSTAKVTYCLQFLQSCFISQYWKKTKPSLCISRGATMSSLPETTRSLMQIFNGKLQDFTNEIDNVHMVWLEEIQQEAYRMFSRWATLLMRGGECYTLYTVLHACILYMWDSLRYHPGH